MHKCMFLTGAVLALSQMTNAADLKVRAKNFIVTPSTGPVAEVIVKNAGSSAYTGVVTPQFPEKWEIAPGKADVTLAAGEQKTLSFAIRKGFDLKANEYAMSIAATGNPTLNKTVVCATTPYFKPKIDGKLDEWADAVPIAFEKDGKKTVVRSYWNKSQFCLAVEVHEDALVGQMKGAKKGAFDAIQFALAPGKTTTGDEAVRFEYLVMDSGMFLKPDLCYQLAKPGDKVADLRKKAALSPLQMDKAEVKVKHAKGVTVYELAVPMKPMKSLKVTAGREYCFSLLVHDPDGTGVRDLGSVMNLWEEARTENAWSDWQGAQWDGYKPFDGKVEFGFCSSVH